MPSSPLIHIYNGDADGLVSQHISALARGAPDIRVTGWKRDIQLLRKLPELARARLRVFDISLRQNRAELDALLAKGGVDVEWFDHHDPGDAPAHARLELHINQAPGACTAFIVDAVCGKARPFWAAMAAFGDNVPVTGEALLGAAEAAGRKLTAEDKARLARCGVLLNYNAYGERPGDVLFDPAGLAERMAPFGDALDFCREENIFAPLSAQFEADREKFRGLRPLLAGPGAAAYRVPDEAWARRFAATWANETILAHPAQALAMLNPRAEGGYVVSIRAPRGEAGKGSAAVLAAEFPTGGGRRLAAGINALPEELSERFLARFLEYYRS